MHARVSTYTGTSEQLDRLLEGIDRVRSELSKLNGFQGAYGLVDRDSGKAMTITLWDSEHSAQASADAANRMRKQAAEASGHTIQSVDTYEVGLRIGEP
jgi:heme-degrading monooxygenase HmoA